MFFVYQSHRFLLTEIRTFRNADPPLLLEIWQKCAKEKPEHFHPLSLELLEQHIIGSPYFDRSQLFIAAEGATPLGFAHAAFGPNADHSGLDYATGIVCLVMVVPDCQNKQVIAEKLLTATENYLISHGAKQIFGGASRPIAPFYMGLYGGSEPLGVFVSDQLTTQLFLNANYYVTNRTTLGRLDLEGYRPPINAKTVSWRRKLNLIFDDSPQPSHWWEACMMCNFEWLELSGTLYRNEPPIAKIIVRIMQSAERSLIGYYMQRAGLLDIQVDQQYQRNGLASFMLGEMIRELQKRNVRFLEIQAPDINIPLMRLLNSMKWNEVEQGAVFLKKISE
jgi:GNAT superfamily N-acetyltransferase